MFVAPLHAAGRPAAVAQPMHSSRSQVEWTPLPTIRHCDVLQARQRYIDGAAKKPAPNIGDIHRAPADIHWAAFAMGGICEEPVLRALCTPPRRPLPTVMPCW